MSINRTIDIDDDDPWVVEIITSDHHKEFSPKGFVNSVDVKYGNAGMRLHIMEVGKIKFGDRPRMLTLEEAKLVETKIEKDYSHLNLVTARYPVSDSGRGYITVYNPQNRIGNV